MASQVRCGPRATGMGEQFDGKTVGQLRQLLESQLNIPAGAPATISRDGGMSSIQVQESYRLMAGDLLEFTRPAGTKGC